MGLGPCSTIHDPRAFRQRSAAIRSVSGWTDIWISAYQHPFPLYLYLPDSRSSLSTSVRIDIAVPSGYLRDIRPTALPSPRPASPIAIPSLVGSQHLLSVWSHHAQSHRYSVFAEAKRACSRASSSWFFLSLPYNLPAFENMRYNKFVVENVDHMIDKEANPTLRYTFRKPSNAFAYALGQR